jgi:tetratricopeptide (TPR) repeat protein
VKLDPLSPQVSAKAGEIALALGRPEEAETWARRALELDSTSIFPHITLALLEKNRGNLDVAIAEAEKATELAPDDAVALSALGDVLAAAGRTEEAQQIVSRLESEARAGKASHAAVAQIHIALGEMSEALHWLKQAAEHPRERMVAMTNPRIRQSLEKLRADPALAAAVDSLLRRPDFPPRPPRSDSTKRSGFSRSGTAGRDGR